MSSTNLDGQVALVTGGGRGLGRGFALGLTKAGMRVVVAARSRDQVEETASRIERDGGTAAAVTVDVTDPQSVRAMARETEERLGPVDLLVNNAGAAGPMGPAWEADAGDWWRCLETNLRGPLLCCREILPGMIARGRGRIINIASGAGTIAIPYMSAYVTSKAALIRFTEILALETRRSGVSVFSIQPGTVKTAMAHEVLESEAGRRYLPWFLEMFERGEDQPPDQAVDLVLFLASGKADALSGRFFTVPEDPAEVVKHAEQIRRDDLYTLRLRRLGS